MRGNYGFKRLDEMANGKVYIVDKTGDSWYFEWTDETTISLMHNNKRNLSSGAFHHQREFINMNKNNIHIVYKYIYNHSTKVYKYRNCPRKNRMDRLFEQISR